MDRTKQQVKVYANSFFNRHKLRQIKNISLLFHHTIHIITILLTGKFQQDFYLIHQSQVQNLIEIY